MSKLRKLPTFLMPLLKRLAILLLLLLCTVPSVNAEDGKKRYPPYPDVWGVELPVSTSVDYAAIDVIRMTDGDFMVVYAQAWGKAGNKGVAKFVGKEIFSGARREFKTEKEYNEFLPRMRKDGRVLERSSAVFGDGSAITDLGRYSNRICTPLFGDLGVKDRNGKILSQKLVLYVYDKPIKKEVDPSQCESHWDHKGEFYYQGVHFLEEMTYHTLDEDTFLIVGFLKHQRPPSIVILRFDKDWKTKSDLIDRKVFIVDQDVYDTLWERYGNEPSVNQAMYDYLMKIRKGGKQWQR